GVFMTKEDVIAKAPSTFRKEYWGHYVVTPVDRIEIFISFPEGYRVSRFFVGACIGSLPSAQTMHGEEIQRILTAGSFEPGENWARLKIESPYIGFSYLIYWDPPSQKEVDALKLVYEPLPQGEGGATHG